MKTKSKILLSSIASIALCSSIAVGGTFALFTSESQVNIAVTSGKVEVVATATGLETWSMGEKQTTGEFENGGTAVLDENELTLTNVTPGDKATFTINVENNSTISVKYRLMWTVSGDLANGLEILANNAALAYVDWTTLAIDEDVAPITVSVELPVEAGNQYQEKSASISFLLEAVQNNADVTKSEAATEAALLKALNDPAITNITLNGSFDVTNSLTVPADRDLTLDLNSNTVNNVNNSVMNRGNVTISDGTIKIDSWGFENYGTATITDVTMEAGSASNYSNITIGADAQTTYNNVTVKSAGGGIGAANGAEVIFNSGSVEVNTTSTSGRYLFYAEGEGTVITINGGDFADFTKTSQNQKRAYIYAGAGTTVYVNGGTFGKASTREDYKAGIRGDGTVIITGGTFGFDPSAWVADGYQAVESNGVWTVSAI